MQKVRGKGLPTNLIMPLPTTPRQRAIFSVLSKIIRRADLGSNRGLLFLLPSRS